MAKQKRKLSKEELSKLSDEEYNKYMYEQEGPPLNTHGDGNWVGCVIGLVILVAIIVGCVIFTIRLIP